MDGDNSPRTFGQVYNDVGSFRHFVTTKLNLKYGDVAMVMSPNHVDYFAVVHGLCSAGVAVSPVNSAYTAHEVEFQLKNASAKCIVAHSSCLHIAEKAVKEIGWNIPIIVLEDDGEVANSSHASFKRDVRGNVITKPIDSPKELNPKSLAVLPYSSGTTGLPKGVVLSHSNLTSNVEQCYDVEAKFFDHEKFTTVIISPLPMFHIYSFTISMNLTFFHGLTLVTCKRFDLEKFAQSVETYKCTRAHVVPPIVLGLVKSPIVEKYDMSSLKMCLSAAAPLGADAELLLMKRFPNMKVKQGWGMSELSPLATCTPDDGIKPGTGVSGVPCRSTEIKVVDVITRKTLGANKEGELLVRGPQVMQCYLNEPIKTKECLTDDGWLLTGDIAKIDDEGYVVITDRLKELIKVKGFQVAPAELEALLVTHPGIIDAVVIPIEDEQSGQLPRAYVVSRPGVEVTVEEIAAFIEKDVAHYKQLKGGIFFIEKVPKTASGKILRREVVKMDKEKTSSGRVGK